MKKSSTKGSPDDENEGKKTRMKGKDKESLRKSSKPKSSEESSSSSDESSSSESDSSGRKEAVNLTALRAAAKFRGHSRNAARVEKTKRSPKKGSTELDKPMSLDAGEDKNKSTEEAVNLTALRAAAKFRGAAASDKTKRSARNRPTEVDKPMNRDAGEERKKSTEPIALRQSAKQEIRQGNKSQRRSRMSQSAVLPSSNDEMPSLLNEYDARRSERETLKRSMKRSSTGDVSRRQLSQSVSMPKAQSSDDMQRLVREARKQGGVKSRRGVSLSRGDEANTLKRSVRKSSLNGSEREAKMRGNDPPALKQSMRRNTSFNSVESLENKRGKDAALKRSVRKNTSFTQPDTPERTQSRSKRSTSIRKSTNYGEPSADAQPPGRRAELRGLSSSIMMAADTDISAVRRSTKIRGDESRRKSRDVARQSVRRSGKSDDMAELKRQFIL